MPADLATLFNAFDADLPLAGDDARYVDLATVRGNNKIARRLTERIENAAAPRTSYHLLTGHVKCGKTTELNRARAFLEAKNYATVFFDIAADAGTLEFEYTTVLLLMVGHIEYQLAKRKPKPVRLKSSSTKLVDFLREHEITLGRKFDSDVKGKGEVKSGGLLSWLLGDWGLGIEVSGGFERSREVTTKMEADTHGFITAIKELVSDANNKVLQAGYKGLVVICDGCDKLAIAATDKEGRSRDLQSDLFVNHGAELRTIPCHMIYTVPFSLQINWGDIWKQDSEFVPAVPVKSIPGIQSDVPNEGRRKLKEVIQARLQYENCLSETIFSDPTHQLDRLIDASGGHISDLLLLVREAILNAQTDDAEQLSDSHIQEAINRRALEYTHLIESRHLATLASIDQFKTSQASPESRDLIFKRLVLEYSFENTNYVDLHPLVVASEAYRRWRDATQKS